MSRTTAIERLATAAAVVAIPISIAWPGPRAPIEESPFVDLRYPALETAADLTRLDHLGDAIPAAECVADVRIAGALVDPATLPDREGEWVRLINFEPVAVDLRDWRLRRGQRHLDLPATAVASGAGLIIGHGGRQPLRPIQLGNAGGELVLIDPCGVPRSRLGWGGLDCPEALPGVPIVAPGRKDEGPTRSVTGGAHGGCGQT